MNVIRTAAELKSNQRVCLAIGVFDGVHLGHQQILRQTLADARQQDAASLVITFDRHPNAIVAPDRVPPLIYTLAQKLRAIESLGANTVLLIHFDQAFSRQTGEAFLQSLSLGGGRLASVCVGADFTFGHRRSGNVALLRKLGAEQGFVVHALAAVSLDEHAISSTRIRETIRAGDLDLVSQMLGRAYSLAGPVVAGDRLGRQLGFPTANVDVAGLVLPPAGVYAVQVLACGKTHRGVMNLGHRPTLQSPQPELRLEVHLLDFEGDLYGAEIEVLPVKPLREEVRFASLEALKSQIKRDIAAARLAF